MRRIVVSSSDNAGPLTVAHDVMLSAFTNKKELILVGINYLLVAKEVNVHIAGTGKLTSGRQYITTEATDENMKAYPAPSLKKVL